MAIYEDDFPLNTKMIFFKQFFFVNDFSKFTLFVPTMSKVDENIFKIFITIAKIKADRTPKTHNLSHIIFII